MLPSFFMGDDRTGDWWRQMCWKHQSLPAAFCLAAAAGQCNILMNPQCEGLSLRFRARLFTGIGLANGNSMQDASYHRPSAWVRGGFKILSMRPYSSADLAVKYLHRSRMASERGQAPITTASDQNAELEPEFERRQTHLFLLKSC